MQRQRSRGSSSPRVSTYLWRRVFGFLHRLMLTGTRLSVSVLALFLPYTFLQESVIGIIMVQTLAALLTGCFVMGLLELYHHFPGALMSPLIYNLLLTYAKIDNLDLVKEEEEVCLISTQPMDS